MLSIISVNTYKCQTQIISKLFLSSSIKYISTVKVDIFVSRYIIKTCNIKVKLNLNSSPADQTTPAHHNHINITVINHQNTRPSNSSSS